MAFEAAGAPFSPAEIPARGTRVGFVWGYYICHPTADANHCALGGGMFLKNILGTHGRQWGEATPSQRGGPYTEPRAAGWREAAALRDRAAALPAYLKLLQSVILFVSEELRYLTSSNFRVRHQFFTKTPTGRFR